MFRTVDLKAWHLKATEFKVNGVPFVPKGETRVFDINSHLPFLYLPDDDWLRYSELVKKNYPDIVCS